MNFKSLFRHFSILALVTWSLSATAAPLDKSAMSKIDEAINVHYLSTNFDKAEGLLLGTIKACGNRCSASVKARAWMYVGIVRGAGKQDSDGASAAFVEALGLDPKVQLDRDLATDDLKALFEAAQGGGQETTATPEETVPLEETPAAPAVEEPASTMECTPDVAEVETRRPIPVSCKTPTAASRVVLYYKPFGAKKWTQMTLGKSGGAFVGTMPCEATATAGTLTWYVKATSTGAQVLDTSQSEADPHAIEIVQSTKEKPPSLPGKPPPARCQDPADCPEEMRGTPSCPGTEKDDAKGGGGWGDACKSSKECGEELVCTEGSCQSPPSCETDSDCSGGTCQEFLCHYADDGEGEDEDDGGGSSGAKPPGWLFGIGVGLDMPQLDGTGVCNPLVSGTTFQCFISGSYPYSAATFQYANGVPTATPSLHHNPASFGQPGSDYDPQRSGAITSGIVPSTIRITLSAEKPLTDKISVEGRLGLALGGTPKVSPASFAHIGASAKYWFSGMNKGLRLFGIASLGLGRVDAKHAVQVDEYQDDGQYFQGYSTDPICAQTAAAGYCVLPATAYKKMGPGFVGAGLGAWLNLGGYGPMLQILGEIMLPASGFVVQPTAGWTMSF